MALLRRRQAGWSERVLVRAQHETVDSRRLVVGHLFVHRLGLAGSRRVAYSLGIGRWDIQGRGQLTLVARYHAAAAAAAAAGQQLVAYQGLDRSPWAAAYRGHDGTCRGRRAQTAKVELGIIREPGFLFMNRLTCELTRRNR